MCEIEGSRVACTKAVTQEVAFWPRVSATCYENEKCAFQLSAGVLRDTTGKLPKVSFLLGSTYFGLLVVYTTFILYPSNRTCLGFAVLQWRQVVVK